MAETRIDELRRRLDREPGSRLFAQLAEEHRKAGDPGEAIRVARAGLEIHPSYTSARLTLGRALLDAGEAAGARAELTEVLREAPDNILASRFLGQALEMAGDVAGALSQYAATLKMAPGDRQLETHMAALQARLASPGVGEATAAMRPAPPPLPAGTVGARPPRPAASAGPPQPQPPSSAPRPAVPPPPPTERMANAPSGSDGSTAPRARRAEAGSPLASTAAIGPTGTSVPMAEPLPDEEDETLVSPSLTLGVADPTALSGTLPAAGTAATATTDEPAHPAPLPPSASPAPRDGGPSTEALPGLRTPAPVERAGASAAAEPEAVEPGEQEPPAAKPTQIAAGPPPAPEAPPPAEAPPLSSSTLAALYLRQGLTERAREVYREVLVDDPANERARAGLRELETAATGGAPLDERGLRRAALRRTIEALEAMLSAVRRT